MEEASMGEHDPGKGTQISRRKLLASGAAAGLATALGGIGAGGALAGGLGGSRPEIVPLAQRDGDEPDLVLHNGRIHTVDGSDRVVRSATIRDGRFVEVGNAVRAGGQVRVIDLKGRTVVPGLVESHIHSVSMANRPGYHTVLENATSIADIQDTLAARRPEVPEGQWITSMGGWHPNQWAEHRHPTLDELDEAVPDRPVFLYERFTGPCVTNSLGKAFFDAIDAGPLPHPDAVKINVGADGAIATGGFGVPTPSTTALFVLRSLQTFEDRKRSSTDMMAYSASVGLTAHLDQVLFPTPGPLHPSQVLSNLDHYRMYDPLLELHREGKSLIRMQFNFLHNQADPELPELKERLKNQFQFFGDDMQMTGSIGEWAAPLGAGPVWQEAQRLVANAGWRNENAVGSLAQLEQVVAEYEAVNAQVDITGLRWMVHHVPVVTDDLLNRLKALGGGVVMRAFTWIVGTPQSNGAPFRAILDNGIQAGIEGDGVHISTLNPWPHIQYAVTGVNALGVLINDGQQITRQEALRLFTRENAWFLRMEDRIGSIEPGKLADLVVLSDDYFAVPEDEIRTLRSVLTVVGGRVVHDEGVVG
jgi:predicted amidohydrolase YtcJ